MNKVILSILALISALFAAHAREVAIDVDGAPLIVFLPDTGRVDKTVLILPGGGYTHLAMQHEGTDWTGWFNDRGCAAAVFSYPMPGGDHEKPLASVRKALAALRDKAPEMGIDPARIGVMGSSAGGHLASTAATHLPEAERPAFQILFYPVVTMDTTYTHPGSRKNLLGADPSAELEKRYSNALRVDAATPRAFIALSGDDKAVHPANSLQYYNALLSFGIPASLHIYPTGGHGWGFRPKFKYHNEVLTELQKWLETI